MISINKFVHTYFLCILIIYDVSLIYAESEITRETGSCGGRQTPGPICESCELLAICVRQSSGWMNIPVEACDTANGYYCNARYGGCSNMTGPCHPFGYEGNFPCTSQGIFPDPYDCQKYHMCYFVGATLVSATVECDSDKAFDAKTGQCTLNVDNAVCKETQFHCLRVGDAKPWPANPNIFYVCKATTNQAERLFYPSLYRCADGDIFDGYYCLPTGPTASAGDGAVNISVSTEKMSNSNMPIDTNSEKKKLKCIKQGVFVDKDNCRKYYYCASVNNEVVHMECPKGTYFSAPSSACAIGTC